MTALPIDSVLPDLLDTFIGHPNVVLQASPGAGKTTRVPLALLDAPWRRGGKIILLEPRRLAARGAAVRMAETLGEVPGETVGYRIQLDTKVSRKTIIEVVTEGVLTRWLQRDPELTGVAAVIFDEFHERTLQADLGLALCLDAQAGLREDLRLLIMSATLDVEPVAKLMGNAPIIKSEGRSFPVDVHYLGLPLTSRRGAPKKRFGEGLASAVNAAVQKALEEETGSLLVFLPGESEIRRAESLLNRDQLPDNVFVVALFGSLSQSKQDQALRPAANGYRKVVLATAIAETSLTIEGIRVVIDGGLSREPRFDPQSGMTQLVTETVSLASAEQRTGRAGRLEAGVCYRLWDKAGEGAYRRFRAPEIQNADLASLALDLAGWGLTDANALSWLTPPPSAALDQARDLLKLLGALDKRNRITAHGREMARLPLHPRLAHMVIESVKWGCLNPAYEIAALLSERDIVLRDANGPAPVDLNLRVAALRGEKIGVPINHNTLQRARSLIKHWNKDHLKTEKDVPVQALEKDEQTGALVALAYPDRIAARRKGNEPRYRQVNGKGAILPQEDALHAAPFLALAEVAGEKRDAKIRTAAALQARTIERLFEDHIVSQTTAIWDRQSAGVLVRKQRKLNALVLKETQADSVSQEQIALALCTGIRELGLARLPWSKEAQRWRQRVVCLKTLTGEGPDLSDAHLLETINEWLLPYLTGMTKLEQLKSLDLMGILKGRLGWQQQQELDRKTPSHLRVASGNQVAIDYSDPTAPVLPVKLQEMYGTTETPCIADGQIVLTVHLLSPAGRPLQITQDLAAFWQNAYPQVKGEMRGRYPKHPWPDDPLSATPTSYTKARSRP